MNINKLVLFILVFSVLLTDAATAATRIAVLDFELNDITSLPNAPAELKRTASMAPLLSKALSQIDAYEIVPVETGMQKAANDSFGYLFRFHDLAAQLGRRLGADWIIVSQHSKPSFLFSYLWVYLIDVKKQTAVARYDIELKGSHEKVTEHAVASLAGKIQATISGIDKR
ncbi:DUF2380 domain-containing protein [Methylobacter sp. Wu8]|uniref:DUF2380 domain-containing protein n=1 Tax=Methylobacter sp. Wu8 TaxID=3118457 RepID=UPI002F3281E7|nr:DUF3280 domain-containing protein [Methylobacter tundripaludum]